MIKVKIKKALRGIVIKLFYLFAVFLTSFGCQHLSKPNNSTFKSLSNAEKIELKNVLINIYDQDQGYRAQAMLAFNQFGLRSEQVRKLAEKLNNIDSIHLIVVKSIIKKHGWLGSKVVGEKANSALYLVIQHSQKDDRAFFLPIMRKATQNNSAKKQDLAHLEDRVANDQGRKQLYGTQIGFDEKTKKYFLFPLENPDSVDVRRSKMGLIPIRAYLSQWQIVFP